MLAWPKTKPTSAVGTPALELLEVALGERPINKYFVDCRGPFGAQISAWFPKDRSTGETGRLGWQLTEEAQRMAKHQVFLVDADVRSAQALTVGLRTEGYDVVVEESLQGALAGLQTVVPDLVVCEAGLPDGDGLQLVRWMKARESLRQVPVVLIMGENALAQRVAGLELGVEECLTRPVLIRELVTRVRMLLARKSQLDLAQQRAAGLSGSLDDLAVIDLLRMLEAGRRTGRGTLQNGREFATLYFRDGQVIDADLGRLRGEEAVYRLLTWRFGTFELSFVSEKRSTVISTSTNSLIAEGLRRVDELKTLTEALPGPDLLLDVDHDALRARLQEVPEELALVLRLINGERDQLALINASPYDDLSTLRLVATLYAEGLLRTRSPGAQPPPRGEAGASAAVPGPRLAAAVPAPTGASGAEGRGGADGGTSEQEASATGRRDTLPPPVAPAAAPLRGRTQLGGLQVAGAPPIAAAAPRADAAPKSTLYGLTPGETGQQPRVVATPAMTPRGPLAGAPAPGERRRSVTTLGLADPAPLAVRAPTPVPPPVAAPAVSPGASGVHEGAFEPMVSGVDLTATAAPPDAAAEASERDFFQAGEVVEGAPASAREAVVAEDDVADYQARLAEQARRRRANQRWVMGGLAASVVGLLMIWLLGRGGDSQQGSSLAPLEPPEPKSGTEASAALAVPVVPAPPEGAVAAEPVPSAAPVEVDVAEDAAQKSGSSGPSPVAPKVEQAPLPRATPRPARVQPTFTAPRPAGDKPPTATYPLP